jgi:hypothetical protein
MSRVAVCNVVLIALTLYPGHALVAAKDDKGPAGPKGAPTPFVEIGPTLDLHWGVQSDPGKCTMLTVARVKELRVGLVLIKGGEEMVVEERTYTWGAEPLKPVGPDGKRTEADFKVQGVVQVQLRKQGASQYTVSFGAGFEDPAGWDYTKKPKEVVVEGVPTEFAFRQGGKKAGEAHVVRIDVIHGGDKRVKLGEVKSLDELKRATKEAKLTTYLVTTLHWVPTK